MRTKQDQPGTRMTGFGSLLNKYWRVCGTGFSFAVFGLGAVIIAAVLSLALWPMPISRQRKQRWTRHIIWRATWCYVRMMRFLGLLTFEFHDIERLNVGGELVVANHPSLLDVVFLLSVMPNTNCIIKSALFKNPFTAGVVSLAGYIPNSDNGEALIHNAAQNIRQGQTLIVFPEGTRTRNFDDLYFKRGAANIALRAECPVRPVIIDCQPKTLRKHDKWYHVPPTPPHFMLAVLEPLDIRDCIDLTRPQSVQARHLTRCMHDVIVDHMPCQ